MENLHELIEKRKRIEENERKDAVIFRDAYIDRRVSMIERTVDLRLKQSQLAEKKKELLEDMKKQRASAKNYYFVGVFALGITIPLVLSSFMPLVDLALGTATFCFGIASYEAYQGNFPTLMKRFGKPEKEYQKATNWNFSKLKSRSNAKCYRLITALEWEQMRLLKESVNEQEKLEKAYQETVIQRKEVFMEAFRTCDEKIDHLLSSTLMTEDLLLGKVPEEQETSLELPKIRRKLRQPRR